MAQTTSRLTSHPRKTLLIVRQGPAAPRAEGLTSEEHRSMGGDPKTPKDAVLDPEERLDLLLGRLGSRREGLPEKEAAASIVASLMVTCLGWRE